MSNIKTRTLNGVFLTLKFVKIPNKRLDLTAIIINISRKKYEPLLLERMTSNTLIRTERGNTLKLFDAFNHQS